MAGRKAALQLYTLRDECAKDFRGTLEKVAEMGYGAVEFAGNYGGMNADELKDFIGGLGLECAGCHIGIDQFASDTNGIIDFCLALGCKYPVCPGMGGEYTASKDGYLKASEILQRAAEDCKKDGLVVCYHNHDFEFATFDNEYALDILLGHAPDVKSELDIYWVKFAELDPIDYMKKLETKTALVHVKDMADDAEKSMTEVGNGIIDMPAVFDMCSKNGVEWTIVEQDECKKPPIESAQIAIANLGRAGLVDLAG